MEASYRSNRLHQGTSTSAHSAIVPPGFFRIFLAYIVFFSHTVPLRLGDFAVLTFFILSGFWVYQMWREEYSKTKNPISVFIVSRVWRIVPIYYVMFAINGLSIYFFATSSPLLPYWMSWEGVRFYFSQLFILGYAPLPDAQRIFAVVWSLDIELQFYVFAPLIIYIIKNQISRKISIAFLMTIAFIGLVCQFMFYHLQTTHAFLPMYLWAFLIGLGAAHVSWRPDDRLSIVLAAIAILVVAASIALPVSRPLFCMGSFSNWLSEYNEYANVALAVLVAPYALSTVRRSLPKGSRISRLDRNLSNVTYEIYLLHPSFVLIIEYMIGTDSRFHHLPLIVMSWVVVFPAAYLIYVTIDRPIDKRRRAFVKSLHLMTEPVK